MSRKVSRKERELLVAKQTVQIVSESNINETDRVLMAEQCRHFVECEVIGAYSSTKLKYCIHYQNRWFFCVYDRDANKVSTILPFDILTVEEQKKFHLYKSRLESEKRIRQGEEAKD